MLNLSLCNTSAQKEFRSETNATRAMSKLCFSLSAQDAKTIFTLIQLIYLSRYPGQDGLDASVCNLIHQHCRKKVYCRYCDIALQEVSDGKDKPHMKKFPPMCIIETEINDYIAVANRKNGQSADSVDFFSPTRPTFLRAINQIWPNAVWQRSGWPRVVFIFWRERISLPPLAVVAAAFGVDECVLTLGVGVFS